MKVVVSEFISLDGVVQAPGGAEEDTDGGFAHGAWSMPFFDPATMGPFVSDGLAATEALLFGRRTYETMAGAWPDRAGDPFADRMNELPKYVASRTLSQADLSWANAELLPVENVVGAVRGLRDRAGGDLQVMGSPSLAATLNAHDLVDEYRLMVVPVVLGGGKRLFSDDGHLRAMTLVATATSGTGVLLCTYRPQRPG